MPESVTVHEAGHQFWYGLVGNNEFEHAWLDEGLNTYAQVRALDAAYGPRRLVQRYLPAPGSSASNRGFFPLVFRDIEAPRLFDRLDRYRAAAHRDAPSTATFLYQPETAADITYSKTALWLGTLERHLGWERLRTILATFFERYRFGHPTPDAFFAVVDEHAGEDLRWFFDAVYRDAVDFDYAVGAVSSAPRAPRGFVEREGRLVLAEPPARQAKEAGPFRSEVVVERRGDGVFPVDVRLVFADGTERQERWDGRGRHHTIVVEDGARLEYAVVDPERKLLLDLDYTNNSRLRESRATAPAFKWASKWMVWFQDFLTTFTFFA